MEKRKPICYYLKCYRNDILYSDWLFRVKSVKYFETVLTL